MSNDFNNQDADRQHLVEAIEDAELNVIADARTGESVIHVTFEELSAEHQTSYSLRPRG